MRRFYLAVAAAASLFSATSLTANRAEAMTLPAPAGLQLALEGSSLTEEVRWVCNRRGRRCRWIAGPRYYGGYHGYRPNYYYGRPYYRHRGPGVYFRF